MQNFEVYIKLLLLQKLIFPLKLIILFYITIKIYTQVKQSLDYL